MQRVRSFKMQEDENKWKEKLSDFEFNVCRQKGTEAPFSGKYNDFKEKGVFTCKCCNTPLFSSSAKYNSGSGWPSFFESINNSCIKYDEDLTLSMSRIEITCKECGCHLGHVFDDGPEPTKKRFCVNSVSLNFDS